MFNNFYPINWIIKPALCQQDVSASTKEKKKKNKNQNHTKIMDHN